MTPHHEETNGRIKLTFGQLLTVVGFLVSILGTLVTAIVRNEVRAATTDAKIDALRAVVDNAQQMNDFKHGTYEHRLDALEAHKSIRQ